MMQGTITAAQWAVHQPKAFSQTPHFLCQPVYGLECLSVHVCGPSETLDTSSHSHATSSARSSLGSRSFVDRHGRWCDSYDQFLTSDLSPLQHSQAVDDAVPPTLYFPYGMRSYQAFPKELL